MAFYFMLVAAVHALFLQTAYSQCINRVVPNCGQNVLPIEAYEYMPIEGLLSNQALVSQAGSLTLPALPNYAQYPMPSLAAAEPIAYAPTVIQDSSVANSLANALQLLVVSNLLSNTLPGSCNPGYFVEPYQPVGPVGPYGYIY